MGQFYSNPKLHLAKHRDFRYMPNIISSAIANTPPSDFMADVLNKRNKVHHFDKETDEDMIQLFAHGVDGKPRKNKRLLPHRNWCSHPGNTSLERRLRPARTLLRTISLRSARLRVVGSASSAAFPATAADLPCVPMPLGRPYRQDSCGPSAAGRASSESARPERPESKGRTLSLSRDLNPATCSAG